MTDSSLIKTLHGADLWIGKVVTSFDVAVKNKRSAYSLYIFNDRDIFKSFKFYTINFYSYHATNISIEFFINVGFKELFKSIICCVLSTLP